WAGGPGQPRGRALVLNEIENALGYTRPAWTTVEQGKEPLPGTVEGTMTQRPRRPSVDRTHPMISFNTLGHIGRFGNQMFQYAALLGIARRKGYEFCIPPETPGNERKTHQLLQAFELPSLKCLGWQRTDRRITGSSFAYDAKLANDCPD